MAKHLKWGVCDNRSKGILLLATHSTISFKFLGLNPLEKLITSIFFFNWKSVILVLLWTSNDFGRSLSFIFCLKKMQEKNYKLQKF